MAGSDTPALLGGISSLPLTDPRCSNETCLAFKEGLIASNQQISWTSQFLYGKYVALFYVVTIAAFSAVHIFQRYLDKKRDGTPVSKRSLWDAVVAMQRRFSYRRYAGSAGRLFGLPSFGVFALILLALAGSAALAFFQHPYYRAKRGYGSPPLGVRTGMMATALIPLVIALAGKVGDYSQIYHKSVS